MSRMMLILVMITIVNAGPLDGPPYVQGNTVHWRGRSYFLNDKTATCYVENAFPNMNVGFYCPADYVCNGMICTLDPEWSNAAVKYLGFMLMVLIILMIIIVILCCECQKRL